MQIQFMNRLITNSIRFVLDECLPPIIRDNKYFMYIFFYIWFKGKNVKSAMNFKSIAYKLSSDEMDNIYKSMETFAKIRATDLNNKSIQFMLAKINSQVKTIIDIGCGNGYWLSKIDGEKYSITGCDVNNRMVYSNTSFFEGRIENLPFEDNSFDLVTCHHTLEHISDIKLAINELKRIAKKQIMIVVPKQRYYYYTLDYHLHFFHFSEKLTNLINLRNYTIHNIQGDWVYIGYL